MIKSHRAPVFFDVRDYAAAGNGVADDTAEIQAAIAAAVAAGGGIVFFPAGTYKTTATIKTYEDVELRGVGKQSSLAPSSVSGAAILTYGGSGSGTEPNQCIRDLNISGSATCAIAFAHCPLMLAERITLNGFTGTDGYVFEYIWACQFNHLSTNGATLSRSCFKVNKVVLDSIWRLPYTSNTTDFNLYLDQSLTEYSTGSATGFGRLQFDTFTAQGAEVGGLALVNVSGLVSFRNLYTENVRIPLMIGKSTTTGGSVDFYSCDFAGDTANTPYAAMIQGVGGINFYGGRFDDKNIVIGAVTGPVTIAGAVRVSYADMWSIIARTGDTPSSMPLTMLPGARTNEHSGLIFKTTGYGSTFYEMVIDNTGAWVASSKSATLADWQPITSLTYAAGTATVTCATHGYANGNSITIEGASPSEFNGTYTIGGVTANTFTYTPGGAPSPTTAIGAPMCKV